MSRKLRIAEQLGPATVFAEITPAAVDLDPVPRALWVNQACTLTLEDSNGNSETLTVDGAGPVDISPTRVTAISTGTVIGLY